MCLDLEKIKTKLNMHTHTHSHTEEQRLLNLFMTYVAAFTHSSFSCSTYVTCQHTHNPPSAPQPPVSVAMAGSNHLWNYYSVTEAVKTGRLLFCILQMSENPPAFQTTYLLCTQCPYVNYNDLLNFLNLNLLQSSEHSS